MSRQTRADLALLAVTLIWGMTFTLIKSAVQQVPVIAFIAWRFALAAAVLAAVYRRHLAAIPSRAWRGGIIAGLGLAAAYLFQTFGLVYTTPSRSAFLTSLCTVLVPLLALCVYKSVPRFSEGLGVAMAFGGTALLTLSGIETPGQINRGDLLTAGAALAFAFHILTVGHFTPQTGFQAFSVIQITCVALVTGSLAWTEPGRFAWSGLVAFAVLVTGLLCTGLAFTVQAWAQQYTTATRAALIFAVEPVSAAGTSYLIMGELLTGAAFAGAFLILAGVLMVELWKWSPGNSRQIVREGIK
jgi:drug/metabolite transporter (DMT)-like permease